MIKRTKNNKKKGFTLIELIIVLAVLVIIAAIAIPNFVNVRKNSETKADNASIEQVKRIILTEISDREITGSGKIDYVPSSKTLTPAANGVTISNPQTVKDALNQVKEPADKTKTTFEIDVQSNDVSVKLKP
ncbi:type IV pilus assembly protein PilA [Clostridium cavendishii DSM 21758]|uniref:Type IV pilus assembly protein PilA n=1 Tax=Clostridium cavendishii DSM 21758 TaxID=1121302 RepID=A0A1M6LJS4_9CLOT|nr:prepilin-type N-terminal cleavage/methylation domain-containing protein [Clostridium cavendishii]SHJ71419.1 type IV pilus assembly protein PilA [Clostridium cavendishii DSM 21758]